MAYIGVDIGGTNISVGVISEQYEILLKKSCKTKSERPYEEIRDDIAQLARETAAEFGAGLMDFAWIGVGCPGVCNVETGTIEISDNLRWHDAPLGRDLQNALRMQVYVENDANAAAYGEYLAGAAKGAGSVTVITLGTGVGSGVIIDGKMLYGGNYGGAEIGHTVLEVDGPQCACGRRGCFGVFSSATGLIRMTREALEQTPRSLMRELADRSGKISARTPFDAAKLGDEAAERVVGTYIKYLAHGLGNVINIFQPDCLCIGGGVCNEGDNLLVPLKKEVEQNVLGKMHTKLMICELGNDAGIIGAALLGKMRRYSKLT